MALSRTQHHKQQQHNIQSISHRKVSAQRLSLTDNPSYQQLAVQCISIHVHSITGSARHMIEGRSHKIRARPDKHTISAICRGSLTCSPSNKESRASSTDVACLFRTINLITKVSGVNTKHTMVLHPQGPLWSLHKPPHPTPIKPKVFGYLKRIKRQPNAENPA